MSCDEVPLFTKRMHSSSTVASWRLKSHVFLVADKWSSRLCRLDVPWTGSLLRGVACDMTIYSTAVTSMRLLDMSIGTGRLGLDS